MVTVTKHNFLEESNSLIQKLPSAAFISIDLEMTGIGLPHNSNNSSTTTSQQQQQQQPSQPPPRPNKSDNPSERYTKNMKQIPERYNIIQMGIAIFHENPKFKRYVKKKVGDIYNDYEDDDHNDENHEDDNDYENYDIDDDDDINHDDSSDDGDSDDDHDNGDDGNNGNGEIDANIDIDRTMHNSVSLEDLCGRRRNVINELVGSRRRRRHCHFRDLEDGNMNHNDTAAAHSSANNRHDSNANANNAPRENQNGFENSAQNTPKGQNNDDSVNQGDTGTSGDNNINASIQNDDDAAAAANATASASNNENHSNEHDTNENNNDIRVSINVPVVGMGGDDNGDNGDNDDDSEQNSEDDSDDSDDNHDDEDNDNDHTSESDNSMSNDDPNEEQEPPEFLVYKYNFFLFPSPHSIRNVNEPTSREVTLNPTSIAFLIEQEMNFQEWIVNGIPYTTLSNANTLLKLFHARYEKESEEKEKFMREKLNTSASVNSTSSTSIPPPSTPPLNQDVYEPNEPNEVAFIARSMANLREWIDSAAPPIRNIDGNMTIDEEERLGIIKLVPPPPFKKENLRNCLVRKIKTEYPSLHWYKHNSKNYVLRLSEDEKKKRDERIKRVEWQRMHKDLIGFTRVFKAISDACRGELGDTGNLNGEYKQFLKRSENYDLSMTENVTNRRRVPLVVHNGYLDLLFLLTHFHSSTLPACYNETKELIHSYFPIIYDTKVLATECADCRFHSKNSSLAELYQRHVMGLQNTNDHDHNDILMRSQYPRVEIMNDMSTTATRDAGDDAFMTGAVFQCMSRPMINHIAVDEFDPFDDRTALYIEMIDEGVEGVGSLLFLDEKYRTKNNTTSYFGMNKIFLPHSIFTVRLDDIDDPLKSGYCPSTIFRVSSLENPITIEQINGILSKARDPESGYGKVPYEILSMQADRRSFIVAARIKSPRNVHTSIFIPAHVFRLTETLERHGRIIRHELQRAFPKQSIVSLEDYLTGDEIWNDHGQQRSLSTNLSSFVTGVFNALGFSSWCSKNKNEEKQNDKQRSKKRRRVSFHTSHDT